jgi:hypothetical protein
MPRAKTESGAALANPPAAHRLERAPSKSQPNPLARKYVQHGIAHTTEAAAQTAGKLLNSERLERLKNAGIRPSVVFVQQRDVFFIHAGRNHGRTRQVRFHGRS